MQFNSLQLFIKLNLITKITKNLVHFTANFSQIQLLIQFQIVE